jgi:hypothetical protein
MAKQSPMTFETDLFGEGVREPEPQHVIASAMKRGRQAREQELGLGQLLGGLAGA